jgi:hypothetical protein
MLTTYRSHNTSSDELLIQTRSMGVDAESLENQNKRIRVDG